MPTVEEAIVRIESHEKVRQAGTDVVGRVPFHHYRCCCFQMDVTYDGKKITTDKQIRKI
jgi:hypothetical protein